MESIFFHYCIPRKCKANESCLVDSFHRKLRVSTQIFVCNHCIVQCKKLSLKQAFNGPLDHFFLWFKIFVNLNPVPAKFYLCPQKRHQMHYNGLRWVIIILNYQPQPTLIPSSHDCQGINSVLQTEGNRNLNVCFYLNNSFWKNYWRRLGDHPD